MREGLVVASWGLYLPMAVVNCKLPIQISHERAVMVGERWGMRQNGFVARRRDIARR